MKSCRCVRVLRAAGVLLSLSVVLAAMPPAGAASTQISDTEDDAYRIPDTPAGQPEPRPPMPLLSNDSADIVMARYETAAPPPGAQGAFKVSVTVSGQPNRHFNYIVGARFGEDCWMFHYLTVGETRPALHRCGKGPVKTIPGSRVDLSGNTIAATFSFRRFLLPSQLKNDPVLGPFAVLTCPVNGKNWACEEDTLVDFAYSEGHFEI